ncbi:hypothetical protein LZC95_50220 [Pendulispora brunnea]|uniref:Uncharacterized protein n=1 Tax=Pendulispora brunnea TaxID=2905690 RepID=A0ABZ2KB25_9BACT
MKGALLGVVRALFARIDYLALYSCRVVSQNADGSLELMPDDARVPGLSRVEIQYGVPGVKAKVKPGSRVMVGWQNGDPAKPYAALWEPEGLELLILADGSRPIARQGDAVQVLVTLPGMPAYGTIISGAERVHA